MDVPTDAAIIETATAAGIPRRRFAALRAQRAALADLQGAYARLLVLVDLSRPIRAQPVRRVHRQRQAADGQLRGQLLLPGAAQLSGDRLRRHLRDRSRLSRSGGQGDDRGKRRLDPVAADPLLLRHAEQEPANGLSGEADLDADHRPIARTWPNCAMARRASSRPSSRRRRRITRRAAAWPSPTAPGAASWTMRSIRISRRRLASSTCRRRCPPTSRSR